MYGRNTNWKTHHCTGLKFRKSLRRSLFSFAVCMLNILLLPVRIQVFPNYLRKGNLEPQKKAAMISNAMDGGDPHNFARIPELSGNHYHAVKNKFQDIQLIMSKYRQ